MRRATAVGVGATCARLCRGVAAVAMAAQAARAQATSPADTVLRRAQRLVSEGQGVSGRALVDSVLVLSAAQPARLAEALFWRAALAEQAASAERDYQRVTVEHALSPWSGEALLRLGQLAYARGERTSALRAFERIVVEQAETPIAPVGYFWKGRVLLEQGDVGLACDALREAGRRAAPPALELKNQVEFYAQRCRDVSATPPAPVASPASPAPVASPAPLGSPAPPASGSRASAPASPPTVPSSAVPAAADQPVAEHTATRAPTWSLQVSAHSSRADAAKAARTLTNRGYQARVEGSKAPFRVRIGTYANEGEALRDLARAKQKGLKGARVVRAGSP